MSEIEKNLLRFFTFCKWFTTESSVHKGSLQTIGYGDRGGTRGLFLKLDAERETPELDVLENVSPEKDRGKLRDFNGRGPRFIQHFLDED